MTNNSTLVAVFRELLNRHPRQFAILLIVLIIEGAAAALSVFALVPFADFLLDPKLNDPSRITQHVLHILSLVNIPPNFWVFGLFFVFVNLLKGALEVGVRYTSLWIVYAMLRGLVSDVISSIFKARWGFFSECDQGQLMNTIMKELNNISAAFSGLAALLARSIQLATYLMVPMWLNPVMTASALGLALLFGVPFMFLRDFSFSLGKNNTMYGNIYVSTMNEMLVAARLILGYGRQDYARGRILSDFNKVVHFGLLSNSLTTAIPKLFQPLVILSAVVAMGLALNHQAHISELTAVIWSFLAAAPILAGLLQSNIELSNLIPSYEQLLALRKKANEFEEIEGNRTFIKLERTIELRALNFTYPGRLMTLRDVNVCIKKGQMVALVGESGSGKSTVTDLVMGLLIPESGQVLIDGVPMSDWKQNSFRERIGYVPQDPLLFNASIRENLLWSFNPASVNKLWEALQLANAAEFVKNLPQGIDTVVGDRGVRLSGGQRQRIALARALLRNPELLILDEATSALDSESEQLIQDSIEKIAHETTIVIVAHRLSTIAKADYIYVFEEGCVVEEGEYSNLCKKKEGVFARMIRAQQTTITIEKISG